MKKVLLLSAIFAFVLTGCGGSNKLDGSSPEKLKASIAKLTAGMSEEQKAQFGDAMGLIITDYAVTAAQQAFQDSMSGKAPAETEEQMKARMEKEMLKKFDGKDVQQVLAEGAEIQKKYEAMGMRKPQPAPAASTALAAPVKPAAPAATAKPAAPVAPAKTATPATPVKK